jgi:hypothetical protein
MKARNAAQIPRKSWVISDKNNPGNVAILWKFSTKAPLTMLFGTFLSVFFLLQNGEFSPKKKTHFFVCNYII